MKFLTLIFPCILMAEDHGRPPFSLQEELPEIIEEFQGTWDFYYHQSEFGDRMKDFPVTVIISNRSILVIQEESFVTGGDTIVNSRLWLHRSGKIVVSDDKNAENADEVGGCTSYPIVDFEHRVFIGC